MQLIVVRHGIAEDRAADGSDAGRALTPEGVRKTQAAAVGLARLVEAPDVVLTSPKVRARQTAAILGRVWGVEPRDEPILADASHEDVLAMLARREDDAVALVGHEPTLSRLIGHLISPAPARDTIELKKAGCACLSVTFSDAAVPYATLHWLLTPSILRRLGGQER